MVSILRYRMHQIALYALFTFIVASLWLLADLSDRVSHSINTMLPNSASREAYRQAELASAEVDPNDSTLDVDWSFDLTPSAATAAASTAAAASAKLW